MGCKNCYLSESGVNPALKEAITKAEKDAQEKNVSMAIYKTEGEYFEYLHCPADDANGKNVIHLIL